MTRPISPGEYLIELCNEVPMRITELAARTGYPDEYIWELVNDEVRIDEDTAFRLSFVFQKVFGQKDDGVSAHHFIKVDREYYSWLRHQAIGQNIHGWFISLKVKLASFYEGSVYLLGLHKESRKYLRGQLAYLDGREGAETYVRGFNNWFGDISRLSESELRGDFSSLGSEEEESTEFPEGGVQSISLDELGQYWPEVK